MVGLMANESTKPTNQDITLRDPPPLRDSTRIAVIPIAATGAQDPESVPKATGNKPAANVPHQWGNGPGGQPDWLNDSGGRTCRVCGVSERTDLIRADRKGMKYHYVDAYGVQMTSMVQLYCPTFIGDTNGTLAETKGRVRNLDCQMETIDSRLERLERDNIYLREQLEAKIQLDVTGLVDWLSQVAALARQNELASTRVEVAGLPYAVPMPVADLIRGVGTTIDIEAELVTVDKPEDSAK